MIRFDFSDLERAMPSLLTFQRLMSRKVAELGHVLLLKTNRKSHTGNPTEPSHLNLSYLERLKSSQISNPYIS